MSDDSQHDQPVQDPSPSTPVSPGPQPPVEPAQNTDAQHTQPISRPDDRTSLLERARSFLQSPQVRSEDRAAKYRFLVEKGLNDDEIHGLLQEAPTHVPPIPPRTYPQPPPSKLPGMLIGLLRILTWFTGGSLAILLVYFRYIYPRIAKSYEARLSLRNRQKELFVKLTSSLQSLKESQEKTFAVLPRPEPYKFDPKFQGFHTLEAIFASTEKTDEIPPLSLLRCAFEELSPIGEPVPAELLFQTLEAKNAWIGSEEGEEYARRIWDTLNDTPLFHQEGIDGKPAWTYTHPTPLPTPPLLASLSSLQRSLPEPQSSTQSRSQHTLQALSDFTGYIAAQTYAIPTIFRLGGTAALLSPEAEEVRREIRALKGLVLNRRSFMSSPKPQSISDIIPTP